MRNIAEVMELAVSVVQASRPETTAQVTRGAARLLSALGYAPLAEVTLPNGRRADLMALGPKGQIFIVEVKSSVEDFRTDQKWWEYRPYCDAFGGAVLREAPIESLAGARRKALTLAFARLAAMRTAGVQATTLE